MKKNRHYLRYCPDMEETLCCIPKGTTDDGRRLYYCVDYPTDLFILVGGCFWLWTEGGYDDL